MSTPLTIQEPTFTLHVKNMAGDLLTISFLPSSTVSNIYTTVHESLEEPRPLLSSLHLLQHDAITNTFVPLHTLSDEMAVSLFIDDADIRVEFVFQCPAMVGRSFMNYAENEAPLFMDNEPFERITLTVYVADKRFLTFSFFAHLFYPEGTDSKKRYTDICYHNDDIDDFTLHDLLFTIGDTICMGSSPADLTLDHYGHSDMLLIAEKIHTAWQTFVRAQGCGEIHPYALSVAPTDEGMMVE